ncbi:MAG: glycosyltransferase family 4 protein [Bacteroidales bacterium]|nr:glycosyltransferase family 4 protein [Bacteroidales bacterium]MCF6342509.1 glycosyltransferase family 4 protein [Bacteroidales bacterium]
MKIAVNTRLLLKDKLEGIGWFIYESLKRVVQAHPEHAFFFLFDRAYDESFIFGSNVTPVVIGPQARHPVLHYIWFEHAVPGVLNRIRPDIFISPDAYLSLKTKFKTLLVIHDLNFEHYPGNMPLLVQKYYKFFTPRFAEKATRIATVSNFSKQDIVRQYGTEPKKIDVVYNGANEQFKPLSREEKEKAKLDFADGKDYFVFIGALNPRKNLVNLFRAFDSYRNDENTTAKLVVVGEKMWWTGEIRSTFESMVYRKEVVFTGRLKMKELLRVVGAALAMTYVSLFEGFGIPIVEAFFAEVPVITSEVTSMPEVAGDAALLVNPFRPDDIASAMKKITFDKELRQRLIEKGKNRRQRFSWDNTARHLWQSIEKTLNQNQAK